MQILFRRRPLSLRTDDERHAPFYIHSCRRPRKVSAVSEKVIGDAEPRVRPASCVFAPSSVRARRPGDGCGLAVLAGDFSTKRKIRNTLLRNGPRIDYCSNGDDDVGGGGRFLSLLSTTFGCGSRPRSSPLLFFSFCLSLLIPSPFSE